MKVDMDGRRDEKAPAAIASYFEAIVIELDSEFEWSNVGERGTGRQTIAPKTKQPAVA